MITAEPGPATPCASITRRVADVSARIATAARRRGRDPRAVTLVAVAKTFDAATVAAARDAGVVDIGESRAQELATKHGDIGPRVRWHFVGRLQRNKVKDVVGVATLIHSVDREALAADVAERAQRLGIVQRVLVQVNAGGDDAKAGCPPEATRGLLRRIREMSNLACVGLMAIPPRDVDPRPAFAQLRTLRDDAASCFPEVWHLSMGMSGDLETAVEEGATLVRVGEGVFGPRAGG